MSQPSTIPAKIHDLIGIGFGPSNLALAVSLEELAERNGRTLKTLFIDKQKDYRWHGNTIVGQSTLQISFLKDLVSLRNPTSPYSFVNYLHRQGRLVDFINMGTFYPCRMEYNDYLCWVGSHFAQQAEFGEEVLRVEPEHQGSRIPSLRVISRDGQGREQSRTCRSVVISTGGTPKIPPEFAALKRDARVFHHSRYLEAVESLPQTSQQPLRVAVIGSGQSAAEAFIDLNDRLPTAHVEMILRGSALKPADDSPFVNEIFSPSYTDLVYGEAADERQRLIDEYRNTNYSVVDLDLIESIYAILYRQKVAKQTRHAVLCRQLVENAEASAAGIELQLCDVATRKTQSRRYDAVILATGYERKSHRELLAPLQNWLGDFRVDRHYRLQASAELEAPIYLQGFSESSHGLSDTLLSVLPIRSDDIGRSLYRTLAPGVISGLSREPSPTSEARLLAAS